MVELEALILSPFRTSISSTRSRDSKLLCRPADRVMTESATTLLSVRSLIDELSADPGTKELGERLSDALDVERALTKDDAKRAERLDRSWRVAKRKHLMAKVMENAVNDVICDYEMRLAEDEEALEYAKTIGSEERQVLSCELGRVCRICISARLDFCIGMNEHITTICRRVLSPFQHMQRFVDRFSKAELEDFLHLPMDVAAGGDDIPAPTLMSLTPADVRPGPLPASTRSYVMERIEERLFGVCEGLLRQLEGQAAGGPEKTLKER